MLSLLSLLRNAIVSNSTSSLLLDNAEENPALQTLKSFDDVTQVEAINTLENCLQRKIELLLCTQECQEDPPVPPRPLKLYELAEEKGPDDSGEVNDVQLKACSTNVAPVPKMSSSVQRDCNRGAASNSKERSCPPPILKQQSSPSLKRRKKVRMKSTEVKPSGLLRKSFVDNGPLSVPTDFYSSNVERKTSLHLKHQYRVPKTSCSPLEIKRVYQKMKIVNKLASSLKSAGAVLPGPNEHQEIIDHLVSKAHFYNQCMKRDVMYLGFVVLSQGTVVVLTCCSVIAWVRSKRIIFLRSV